MMSVLVDLGGNEIMLGDQENARLEQSRAALVESLPPLWWGLYERCVALGFEPAQAMQLVGVVVERQFTED